MTKKLAILGSTGSIGTQALEVVESLGLKVSSLCANTNIDLLEKQIRQFKPEVAALANEQLAAELKIRVADTFTKVLSGEEGIVHCACVDSADTVLNSLVGISGLLPTLAAIRSGKDIALANKETLVTAGDIVMSEVKEKGVELFPVDSEHSAIFQCIQGQDIDSIDKIILTASGGPYFSKTKDDLIFVTVEDTLKHPNWSMGKKITVDCATMINKGFEVIEAMHLFNVPAEKIEVIVHRESIIHSMVEFKDGAVMAQMGVPSMKLPIQYALTYPNRCFLNEKLSLSKIGKLSFYEPDLSTFDCLALCIDAAKRKGVYPAAVNGANEVCVAEYLKGNIPFLKIGETVRKVFDRIDNIVDPSLDDILNIDKYSRNLAKEYI